MLGPSESCVLVGYLVKGVCHCFLSMTHLGETMALFTQISQPSILSTKPGAFSQSSHPPRRSLLYQPLISESTVNQACKKNNNGKINVNVTIKDKTGHLWTFLERLMVFYIRGVTLNFKSPRSHAKEEEKKRSDKKGVETSQSKTLPS